MFTEVHRDSISNKVAREIRKGILNHRFEPGQKLPPERELAKLFGTNRNTLREAIRILEQEGLLRIRQGGGMEVLDYRRYGSLGLVVHYLDDVEDPARRLEFLLDAIALRRRAMEVVAEMAARNRSAHDLAVMKAGLGDLETAVKVGGNVAVADIAFHRALGLAAGSMVLGWVVNTIAGAFEVIVRDGTMWVVEDGYLDNMRAVFDAVKRGDPDGAAAAVRVHFEAADAALLDKLAGNTTGG